MCKYYVYKDEDGHAVAVAENATGPNGGWKGLDIAVMSVRLPVSVRDELAAFIVKAMNRDVFMELAIKHVLWAIDNGEHIDEEWLELALKGEPKE